jgi:hypothetical protein
LAPVLSRTSGAMVPVNTSGILPSLVVDDLTAITAPLSA